MIEKIQRAIARRESLRASSNALRIVDGAGDGFDDLEIDDFAGRWLVQTQQPIFPDWLHFDKLRTAGISLTAIYWKQLGVKQSPQWIAGERCDEPFAISENGAQFWIDFNAGYSQGIFLDQRENRQRLREISRGKTVLNTFAYTCAFGVSAALGGASTVNLDLSKNFLAWGRRNYSLNAIDPNNLNDGNAHDFIFGDTFDWLRRFAKKGRRFDCIVLDPPTFSRNEKGDVFTIESGFSRLVEMAAALLTENGALLCSTNQKSLRSADFVRMIRLGLGNSTGWKICESQMPPDFTGDPYLKSAWVEK